jgi:hypothetical protein
LFNALSRRPNRTIADAVRLVESASESLMSVRGSVGAVDDDTAQSRAREITRLVTDKFALEGWVKVKLETHRDASDTVPAIGLRHIVEYETEHGVSAGVLRADNLPVNDGNHLYYPTIHIVSSSSTPHPATPPAITSAYGCRLRWSSGADNTIQYPEWEDGLQPLPNHPLAPGAVLVVVLWKVKPGATPSAAGWAAMPAEVDGAYINHGV